MSGHTGTGPILTDAPSSPQPPLPAAKDRMKITHDDLAQFIPTLRTPAKRRLLHVGCGNAGQDRLPDCFRTGEWQELRIDIDPAVNPDVVASLTDLGVIPDACADAIWSSHNLEHLEDFQVPGALAEFHRVLKPGGFALITLPNLQRIAELIAEGRTDQVMYHSPAGPITPLDMLFGHQASIARGNHYMAHRTGFSAERLGQKLTTAGFANVRVVKGQSFDLWAVAVVADTPSGQPT